LSSGEIRRAQPEDAAAIAAIYAPYVTDGVVSFELVAPDASEMAARMARLAPAYPWLVCEAEGELLGYAYAGPFKERAAYAWSVETTVYLAPRAHRRGIGRALYRRLHAILGLQGFHAAFGVIALPNAASVGLHEACGYRPLGVLPEVGFKFGAWRDVGWWGLNLSAPQGEPAPPLSFTESVWTASARVSAGTPGSP
jgi:L-amino acid N-acyltransferase YncA